MDNIRSVIKLLFRYTSAEEVISGNTHYNHVKKESFHVLANAYMSQYSNNEIENMFQFLKSEFLWHNNKIRGEECSEKTRKVTVFDALLLFTDNVLVEENEKPLCRYEHLLRWRDIIIHFDEDMFITAFLAQKDLLENNHKRNFFWAPVIGHNNWALNQLMAQGVAENHFHMKGSAPVFHLSWSSLMNDVCNPKFKETFEKYEERRLGLKVGYNTAYTESDLYNSYLKAALIRLYLFVCLKDEVVTLRSCYIQVDIIKQYLNDIADVIPTDKDIVDIDEIQNMLSFHNYKKLKQNIFRRDVELMLKDEVELHTYLDEIQRVICEMKERYAPGQLDYTICERSLAENQNNRRLNEVISGERWLLYQIFQKAYGMDRDFSGNLDWFYAYLLIKENLRAELIQENRNVGFDNFKLYQDRKENFIEDTAFDPVYLRMAVRDTILNQHIVKLEARISFQDNWYNFSNKIEQYDNCITKYDDDELMKRFFYVCHFVKGPDEDFDRQYDLNMICRHSDRRAIVKKQALALYEFRKRDYHKAQRIRGIDAASEEIGCRPEVFAQAFRFLRYYPIKQEDDSIEQSAKLPDLRVTYHVGEDFLDIIDGMRAIDEAISFLNMRCGDRLGHALALGVDVDEWYKSKSGYVLISQMDYLDNLVWLYSKIRKFRITDCEDTARYIEKKYDEYFRVVYLNNMRDGYQEAVKREAVEYYEKRSVQNNYGSSNYMFSINTYYDSWKLRGDNPEYFKAGYFKLDACTKSEWDEYGVNKAFPENYRIRYNPEAALLYHTYHYNMKVKREGDKRIEVKINSCIIKAAREVQKKLQWLIGQKGIAIETNPSSNALIGTFKRYDKHPILNWYNNGLEMNHDEVHNVPQLQVSINTDDQGVFATYIENEYAYLAIALEKLKDAEGNPRYSRTLIYQWLDNVRKMGLTQSFGLDNDI